ncbi:hypothetical protein L596_018002 [Steinernema carpocapsae]|nr:hypothetical protein L596_018002 [Steinernema carpocapsae]
MTPRERKLWKAEQLNRAILAGRATASCDAAWLNFFEMMDAELLVEYHELIRMEVTDPGVKSLIEDFNYRLRQLLDRKAEFFNRLRNPSPVKRLRIRPSIAVRDNPPKQVASGGPGVVPQASSRRPGNDPSTVQGVVRQASSGRPGNDPSTVQGVVRQASSGRPGNDPSTVQGVVRQAPRSHYPYAVPQMFTNGSSPNWMFPPQPYNVRVFVHRHPPFISVHPYRSCPHDLKLPESRKRHAEPEAPANKVAKVEAHDPN